LKNRLQLLSFVLTFGVGTGVGAWVGQVDSCGTDMSHGAVWQTSPWY